MDWFVTFFRGIFSQMNMTVFGILTAVATLAMFILLLLLVDKGSHRFWDIVKGFGYLLVAGVITCGLFCFLTGKMGGHWWSYALLAIPLIVACVTIPIRAGILYDFENAHIHYLTLEESLYKQSKLLLVSAKKPGAVCAFYLLILAVLIFFYPVVKTSQPVDSLINQCDWSIPEFFTDNTLNYYLVSAALIVISLIMRSGTIKSPEHSLLVGQAAAVIFGASMSFNSTRVKTGLASIKLYDIMILVVAAFAVVSFILKIVLPFTCEKRSKQLLKEEREQNRK